MHEHEMTLPSLTTQKSKHSIFDNVGIVSLPKADDVYKPLPSKDHDSKLGKCCSRRTREKADVRTAFVPSHVPGGVSQPRVFVLCGDFSMGEIRHMGGDHLPVVGIPDNDKGEKSVTRVEVEEDNAGDVFTQLKLTIFLPSPAPDQPKPAPQYRHIKCLRHVNCYPNGVLLLTQNLCLDKLPPHSSYVIPETKLAKQVRCSGGGLERSDSSIPPPLLLTTLSVLGLLAPFCSSPLSLASATSYLSPFTIDSSGLGLLVNSTSLRRVTSKTPMGRRARRS